MGRAIIQKTSKIIWFDNQQAILPSEAVKEAYVSQINSCPRHLDRLNVEDAARALINISSHSFHLIPYYPHIFTILSSILLDNRSLFQGRDHFLLASHEQQYIIDAFTQCKGATYDWIPLAPSGTISYERLAEALTPRTLLFSLSSANGITGLLEPIKKISALCKERGVLFHLDISDTLGRVQPSSDILLADILTFSSQAIGGVEPIGGMFIQTQLSDLCSRWLPRSSTQPICSAGSLAAMQVACLERQKALSALTLNSISIKNRLKKELSTIPNLQFLFQDVQEKLPNVLVIVIPNIPAESLAFILKQQDIFVGMGGERFQPIAQILQTCSLSPFLCHSALHLSFTENTQPISCVHLAQAIHKGINHLEPAIINYS